MMVVDIHVVESSHLKVYLSIEGVEETEALLDLVNYGIYGVSQGGRSESKIKNDLYALIKSGIDSGKKEIQERKFFLRRRINP